MANPDELEIREYIPVGESRERYDTGLGYRFSEGGMLRGRVKVEVLRAGGSTPGGPTLLYLYTTSHHATKFESQTTAVGKTGGKSTALFSQELVSR